MSLIFIVFIVFSPSFISCDNSDIEDCKKYCKGLEDCHLLPSVYFGEEIDNANRTLTMSEKENCTSRCIVSPNRYDACFTNYKKSSEPDWCGENSDSAKCAGLYECLSNELPPQRTVSHSYLYVRFDISQKNEDTQSSSSWETLAIPADDSSCEVASCEIKSDKGDKRLECKKDASSFNYFEAEKFCNNIKSLDVSVTIEQQKQQRTTSNVECTVALTEGIEIFDAHPGRLKIFTKFRGSTATIDSGTDSENAGPDAGVEKELVDICKVIYGKELLLYAGKNVTSITLPANEWFDGSLLFHKCEDTFDRCTDNIDNDSDSLTDCMDMECSSYCIESGFGCLDGFDNNRDGFTDCEDPSCATETNCLPRPVP